MGSPTIFKGRRTALLTSEGLELKDGTFVDNDGIKNFIKPRVSFWQEGSYSAATRPSGAFTATPAGLTIDSVSPLSGNGISIEFTKDSGNQQGSACVYEFNLPEAYRARSLRIGVDYKISAGTFQAGSPSQDSDLIFYVQEFDGSVWTEKEPSNFKLFSNSSLVDQYQGGFQTNSDTEAVRLIAYVATTNAASWELVADLSVGPSKITSGDVVTDPQNITVTGTWVTNTTYTAKMSKSGKFALIEVRGALTGAPTSATLNINLPFSIDTAAILASEANTSFNSEGVYSYSGFGRVPLRVSYQSATSLLVQVLNDDSGENNVFVNLTQAAPRTAGNGDIFYFTAKIPVQGWSSSTKLSDGYDGRVLSTKIRRPTNQTGINTNNNYVKLLFNEVSSNSSDPAAIFDSVNNRLTCMKSGKIHIGGSAVILSTNVLNSAYRLHIYKNGSNHEVLDNQTPSATTTFMLGKVTELDVIAGDYFELYLYGAGNNGTNTLTMEGSTASKFFLSYIQSPQTIAQGEVIALAANKSGGTHPNNSDTAVTGWTAKIDTHNGFNLSTGIYTFQRAGWVDLNAQIGFTTTVTSGYGNIVVRDSGGTPVWVANMVGNSPSAPSWIIGSTHFYAQAGYTVELAVYQNSGGAATFGGANLNYLTLRQG